MKASEFLSQFTSSTKLTTAEPAFVRAIANGWYLPIRWTEITSKASGHEAKIMVAQDALQIGEPGDSFRVNASHTSEQQIVDLLGLTYPTSKIADLIHMQASNVITPCLQPGSVNDGTMSTVGAMLRHSREVDAKIKGRSGLVSTVGKDWILSNHLGDSSDIGINVGWYDASAPYKSPGGLKMWQTTGTRHNRFHIDLSQVVRPVHPFCVVNGKNMLLWEVMASPKYCDLVSYEGPIKYSRHPAVPMPPGGVVPAAPVSGSMGGGTQIGAIFLATSVVGWLGAKMVLA